MLNLAKCSTKALSKAVTKAFKLIYKQIQNFHGRSHFYFDYKSFEIICVFEISKPVINRLDQLKTKQNAKLISPFDFSTLYSKLPRKHLLKVLFDLIDFSFNVGPK